MFRQFSFSFVLQRNGPERCPVSFPNENMGMIKAAQQRPVRGSLKSQIQILRPVGVRADDDLPAPFPQIKIFSNP